MTSFTFGRILDGLFPSAASTMTPTAASTASAPKPNQPAPIVVGRGGSNERHVTIAGEPALFRDEGDVVVQFRPAFDYDLRETAVGVKLIPALTPHWSVIREFQCSITQAIATAIKESGGPLKHESRDHRVYVAEKSPVRADDVIDNAAPLVQDVPAVSEQPRRTERARYGAIEEWGEKEFPDGKRPGKTYESFCLTLSHRGTTQVLQGEGLRDAIAESKCTIGDSVEVRRLGKIKVPAVDKHGRPKLDAKGAQVLWDKWLWSIHKKS